MSEITEVIKLVNKETEREDLSEEIKEYLFCDLRHKLWKMETERSE